MKLWEITIINAFGIDEQTIPLNGKNLLIQGGTGTGKTSILDSIDACFFGPKERVLRDPSRPAKFIITTEEYEFERTIIANEKGEPVTKKGSDGFVIRRGDVAIKAPATFAKKVVRAQSMRPLVFFEATPAERRAILLRALPIDLTREKAVQLAREHITANAEDVGRVVDRMKYFETLVKLPNIDWESHAFDISKRLYDAAYDARHRIGQDLESKRSIIDGIRSLSKKPYDAGAHLAATSMVGKLRGVSEELRKANAEGRDAEDARRRLEGDLTTTRAAIERLRRELVEAETHEANVSATLVQNAAAIDAWKNEKVRVIEAARALDPECAEKGIEPTIAKWSAEEQRWKDVASANAEIDRQTTNGVTDVQTAVEGLEQKRADYDALTKFAERTLPAMLIDEVERTGRLPLKGLMIDGERIHYNGTSIDVLSSGQRMHFAMQLTLAVLQPLDDEDALKLICVDDLERLDPDLQEIVAQYENPGEVQFIKTRVARGPLTMTQYDPQHPEEV